MENSVFPSLTSSPEVVQKRAAVGGGGRRVRQKEGSVLNSNLERKYKHLWGCKKFLGVRTQVCTETQCAEVKTKVWGDSYPSPSEPMSQPYLFAMACSLLSLTSATRLLYLELTCQAQQGVMPPVSKYRRPNQQDFHPLFSPYTNKTQLRDHPALRFILQRKSLQEPSQVVIMHACHPSTQETEQEIHGFKASQGYIQRIRQKKNFFKKEGMGVRRRKGKVGRKKRKGKETVHHRGKEMTCSGELGSTFLTLHSAGYLPVNHSSKFD